MLQVTALEFAAGARSLCRGLDLQVAPGELWAVLGCNGSGKTTLLHTLAGLRPPRAGRIEIDGNAIDTLPRRQLARRLGMLLQREEHDYWSTLADYVTLGRFPHAQAPFGADAGGEAAVAAALQAFDLVACAQQSFATLSGGERQRARLAQLWAQQARVLLLDEPLQHLDVRHQLQTMRLIRAAVDDGAGAVVVLHDVGFAAQCDRVLMLHGDGTHAQGAAGEMLTPARLEALYGCPMTVCGSGAAAHVMPVI